MLPVELILLFKQAHTLWARIQTQRKAVFLFIKRYLEYISQWSANIQTSGFTLIKQRQIPVLNLQIWCFLRAGVFFCQCAQSGMMSALSVTQALWLLAGLSVLGRLSFDENVTFIAHMEDSRQTVLADMSTLPGYTGARISGCWALRTDGG